MQIYISDLPSIGKELSPSAARLSFENLIPPTGDTLRRAFADLLDKVVARDSRVTRREEQLDQMCSLLLLKLDSDKKAKMAPGSEVGFRLCATANATGNNIRKCFEDFCNIYPDIFLSESEKEIRFSNETIHDCVERLAPLKMQAHGCSLSLVLSSSLCLARFTWQ